MSLSEVFFLYLNVYWAFIFILYNIGSRVKIVQLQRSHNISRMEYSYGKIAKLLLIAFPFIIFVIIALFAYNYYGGMFVLTVDLTKSNDLRMATRASGNQFIITRVLPWAATIIFPLCLVHYAEKRRIITCIMLSLGIIICYSITGMKQWLFIFMITIAAIGYVKICRKNDFIKYFPTVLFLLNGVGLILHKTLGIRQIINYTTRRVLFGPTLNNVYHIEYFYGKPKMYLTQSLFGWIRKLGVQIPYTDDISYVIGKMYYSADTAAPAGTFADAYENFGIFGLMFYPLMLAIIILIFDRAAKDVRPEFYLCVIFVFAYSVLSGGLTIAIMSYGFLFAIIYIALLKRYNLYDITSSGVTSTIGIPKGKE